MIMRKEQQIKKSAYTNEQIAFALKKAGTEAPVVEVIRRKGISEQTLSRVEEGHGRLGL